MTITVYPCWPAQYNQPKRPGDLDLLPFDLESDIRVTCDVGYLCANFGLHRPLCSRLRADVRDRQTSDVRQHHRLMPPGRGPNKRLSTYFARVCNTILAEQWMKIPQHRQTKIAAWFRFNGIFNTNRLYHAINSCKTEKIKTQLKLWKTR